MNSMALRLGIACVAFLGLAACGDDTRPMIMVPDSGVTDSGGPVGTDSGPPRVDSGMVAMSCDDTETECGDSMAGCVSCALAGACSAEVSACGADPDCVSFNMCVGACTDQACADACVAANMTGAAIYQQLVQCVICGECPVLCDGAGAGC